MKKLMLVLLSIFFIWSAWADIDTFEGQSIADLSDIEGQPIADIDKIEGQTIDSGTTTPIEDANCMGGWYMNNNGGDEVDRSGNSQTLTQTSGTIPTSVTVPSGYSGTSREFKAGETEWLEGVDGGTTDIHGADQPLTVALWFDVSTDSGPMNLIGKWDNVSGYRQYTIRIAANDNIECALSGDGDATVAAVAATSFSGSYQHIACVYNDTDIRIYIDGILDSNGADNPKAHTAGIFNGTDVFRIGAENGESYANGLIDEPIVFDRALSAAEILNMKTNGISGDKGASD